jgi:hypothetical protein
LGAISQKEVINSLAAIDKNGTKIVNFPEVILAASHEFKSLFYVPGAKQSVLRITILPLQPQMQIFIQ